MTESCYEMSDIMISMGIKDAFDINAADFTGIAALKSDRILVRSVIHKTFIEVDKRGTKAGAATTIMMTTHQGAKHLSIRRYILTGLLYI